MPGKNSSLYTNGDEKMKMKSMAAKVKLSLASKVIAFVVVTEFAIMIIFGAFRTDFHPFSLFAMAFLDTFILGAIILIVINFTFRPLNSMIVTMDLIGKEGKLDLRLDTRRNDELGVMAGQINRMLDGLKSSYDKIRESESLLTAITDGIDEEIMLIDENFRILWANKKVKGLVSSSDGDVAGNFCYKLTHHLDEPCKLPLDACPVIDISREYKSAATLHTHFDKEGKAYYAEVIAYPLPAEVCKPFRFIHISRDVTERMKMMDEVKTARDELEKYSRRLEQMVDERTAELKKSMQELLDANEKLNETQVQLIQAGKMAAIGQLASGVAHEINNPLAIVLLNAQLVKSWVERDKSFNIDDLKGVIKVIEESILRCKKITEALLGFSHNSSGKFEPVSLNDVAEKALSLVESEMKLENIVIQRELQPDLPKIMGDFLTLQQVFLNIVVNARWAIRQRLDKKDGVITVKTQYKEKDNFISLYISDTGIGIAKEHLSRIFEAFFTTKEIGSGTGLGLSIAYNIIRDHKGSIEAESERNKGATFKIMMPLPR